MIPLKIQLKNFLSYPNQIQTIDFKDYPLICLSGKNGHGKSALLDAITWVLWGQARKISGTIKADAGLIRLGQTQMIVSLEFEFNGNTYKVRREFTKTFGKPLVHLDFELFDMQKEKFISLTDKTIKLTEKKIENLLGLDFDTFINTAFLRQGQANEFSKKSPKERKQILANILGFSRYDELQKKASDKVKKIETDKKVLINILQKTKEEIEKEEAVRKERKQEKDNLQEINKILSVEQKKLLNLEKEKLINEEKKKTNLLLLKELQDLNKKYNTKTQEFKNILSQWKRIHCRSLQVVSFDDFEKIKKTLSLKDKEFLTIQQKSLNLQEILLQKKSIYQKELTELGRKLEQEVYKNRLSLEKEKLGQKQTDEYINQKEKNIIEIEKKIALAEKELFDLKTKSNEYPEFIKNFEKVKNQFEKRRAFYPVLVQKGNWVKAKINDLSQKTKALQCNQSPSCPLCQQVLTLKRKQFLVGKFDVDDKFFIHQMGRISGLLKKLKNILLDQHEQFKKMQKQDDEYKAILKKSEDLIKLINQFNLDLKTEDKAIIDLNTKIKEHSLKSKIFQNSLIEREKELKDGLNNRQLKSLKSEIDKFELELKDLKYDKNSHLKIQKELIEIEKKLNDLKDIKAEESKQNQRRSEISFLIRHLKEIKKTINISEDKIRELKFDKKIEIDLSIKIKEFKTKINTVLKEKDLKLQKLGRLENEIERIIKLKSENKKAEKVVEGLDDEVKYYLVLVKAFGKDGIQALLIEQAIPEIEQEANKILSRLTDNQSQIFFESLRDLKKGGVKETLDIQIADSVGMRPYEMFSGGEAFRVDFALRIAISKLLARRAGTALQTLIIDEGFGSQDEEGLNRLMDAIYAIRDDFAKIIVVSHLPVFKDNFPIHFVVNKSSVGSLITVEERG